jgi:hypothetical protein
MPSSSSSVFYNQTYSACRQLGDDKKETITTTITVNRGSWVVQLYCSVPPNTTGQNAGYYINCTPNNQSFTVTVDGSPAPIKNQNDNGYNLPNVDNSDNIIYVQEATNRWRYTQPIRITNNNYQALTCRIWK